VEHARRALVGAVATALLITVFASPVAAQHEAGDSLVNVQIGDVTVQVPIGVAANLCDINANILAAQFDVGEAECTATAQSIATNGPGNGGGGHQAGDTLVNVQIGDITAQVPVAVAANLCDINVNVLARQVDAGDTTCDADAQSIASPGNGGGGA
jgi:hypothetical protein